MKLILVLSFACMLAVSQAGLIDRQKRGYLARTGVCPDPATNYQKRDPRLNYMGNAVILADEDGNPSCDESECEELVALAGLPACQGRPHLWGVPHQTRLGVDRCPLC